MLHPPRWFVRRVVFPLHERLRGRRTVPLLSGFRHNDRLPRAEFARRCSDLLTEHLRRAARDVPWYRERVDAAAIRGPEDLARFPLIDKATVRSGFDAFRSEAFGGRTLVLETGGSSGEPLRFLSDPVREASQLACKWRARAWHGLDPGSRECDLWGSPIETKRLSPGRRVSGGLLGFQLLSAFGMDDEVLSGWGRRISSQGADFLYGYASVVARYARWLEGRGEVVPGSRLRLAITTAEMLLEEDRRVIARVFRVPVANEYGCRDGGLIAHECPSGGMHVLSDAVHVEILDPAGRPVPDGETGEVCVTNLWATAFPLVRYRLGDRMAISKVGCPCGLPLPLASGLEGRQTDSLVRDDGARVHGLALIYILRELPGVDRFRVEQEQRGSVRVLIVPARGLERAGAEATVRTRTRTVLGAGTEVSVEFVEDMEPLPSGKHRFVICRIPEPDSRR